MYTWRTVALEWHWGRNLTDSDISDGWIFCLSSCNTTKSLSEAGSIIQIDIQREHLHTPSWMQSRLAPICNHQLVRKRSAIRCTMAGNISILFRESTWIMEPASLSGTCFTHPLTKGTFLWITIHIRYRPEAENRHWCWTFHQTYGS